MNLGLRVQGELTGARNGRMGEVRGRAGRRWTGGGLRFEEGGAARHRRSGHHHGWRWQVVWPAVEARAEVLSKKIRCEG
jgi:hypothetical protein